MRPRVAAAIILAQCLCAAVALGADITSGSLQIQGVSLEVDTPAVTTGIDIPTTIQTRFGGKTNDAAPAVQGLLAVGDLTGPGIDTPIQLTTAPGFRFQIPGFSREGVYYLQNVRLMKGNDFVAPATPSAAAITVANVLQTSVSVHQLTPDELRSRGIVVDGRNFNVYEYSFTFLINGQTIVVPFPVIIDPRTHQVTPIGKENPFSLPPIGPTKPPRWSPPDIVAFELPPDDSGAGNGNDGGSQGDSGPKIKRPSIPAAIIIPNSLAVLHQFFAVLLTVSNGAPSGSTARLDDVRATIKLPTALRTAKTNPSVAFGQAVPIVDPTTGVTFLVAQSKGEAEWDLEGLQPGTHTVEIEVRATLRETGQVDVPLKATPRASIVIHDPRFNLNFSHPDTVRKGIDYSTFSFITNISGNAQTVRVHNGVPSCDQAAGANVCRVSGADSDDLTLGPGEMKMVEYKLRPGITGHVFATAGTVDGDTINASVQLHMGVSETGIPLSPTTLVMPYYAQFVNPDLVNANLQLLGLGYSLATAPVNQVTAKFPRVIRSDVFYRAVDIARAGQRIFISDGAPDAKRDAIAGLALDLLGNGAELREWDDLRQSEKSGRIAGASVITELNAVGMNGRSSVGEFVDLIAAATSWRAPFVMAIAHGPAIAGNARPYALSLRGTSGRRADVPNEAATGWVRDLAFSDISRFDVPALNRAGEIALAGRWTEDVELVVTPSVSGPVAIEVIFPGAADGTAMRAHLDLTGTAGEALRVPLTRGASTLNAILPGGGFNATSAASSVIVAPLQIVASRQDLNLDPEGHKVSVLFNRPVALQGGGDWRTKFAGRIAFNRDGVVYNGDRSIFAAAMQEDQRIVNLSFDMVLTTNASYTIAVSPLVDPISQTEVSFSPPLQPKIDNARPAGIVYGKFLKGDNTPIGAAEVRLYTGHWRGCQVGLLDDDPPIDCNPYKEAAQYAKTEADGTFLFEYVPRDPIADEALSGGYRLLGVSSNGRFTLLDAAVRLPGRVHFVNLQLLGRGAAEGVVRYENGQKVAGADVFVGSTMFNIGKPAKTDANGFFHVDDLPVGPITFMATDAAGNVAYASGEVATPGQLITKDLQIIRKPFPGTGTVFGVVRRSDTNAPVVAARVGVYSQGFGFSEAMTDADGRFEFRRVPAGFVTLLAAEWSVSREAAANDFDLHADETHEANLTLSVPAVNTAMTSLSGDVLRENPLFPGDPSKYERVAGAIVKIGGRPVTADSNGHFTFDSIPVAWGASGANVTAYDPSTKRFAKQPIPTLTEAGPNNVSIFLAANSFGTGTVRVRVIGATGQPVTGFRVIEPGFPPTQFNPIGGGVYELTRNVGGSVDVWAVDGPAQYGDQYANATVRLEFPGQIASLTLRLPGQGTVRVKLHGDFDVIGDVQLGYQAWDEAEQMPRPKDPTPAQSTSESGVAGYATFNKVPALQTYTVSSDHPSYGHAGASGTLAYDGDLITHTLQLSKLATIRGTVYAIDGKTPISGAAVRLNDGVRDTGVAYTQPDGTFVYTDVPPSAFFSVTAESTQSGIYRTGVAYGRTPALGGVVDGVSVILGRRGSVEGRVVYIGYKTFDPNNPANNIPDDTPNDLSDNAPVPLAKFWLKELAFPNRSFGSDHDPLSADLAGRFALSNVFIGSLHAKAWDSGNQELIGDWNGTLDEEGQPLTAYVGIGSGGTGSIQVTIADPNQSNAPVVNAEVGLYRGGLFDLTSSDANGVATFQQVPVGTYSISAFSKALGKSGSSPSFVVEKDLVSQLRVLLEFSGKVDGTLIDPEAPPPNGLAGAAVTLSGSGYQTRASTGLTGAFSFDGVREGLFRLDAKDVDSNRRATASHTLSAADPHPIVNLELERTETLYVSVYLPDDTGAISSMLAGPVSIDVNQRYGDFARSAQGNPIVMPKLLKGEEYNIAVQELGGQQRQLTFRGSFPKGAAGDPVKLVYPAYGTVEVTVTQGGAPANGAKVRISGVGTVATLFTDATGRVTANGIRLGDVSAQAVSVDGAFSGSASGPLARTSVPAHLSIDLGAYAGVTGLVEAEAGGPSIGTRVLASFSSRVLEMPADSSGRYTFNGIPTTTGGTTVTLTYIGDDGVTIGARQTVTLFNDSASRVVTLPTVKLDATPPQVVSIAPADGSQNVSPDSPIRIVFSERIRPDLIGNNYLQLVPADGTGQVSAIFDPPVVATDGTFIVTMRPPPPPAGQRFPLKSNTLYRVIVSGAIEDLTGHRLPSPLGITFTTSDYNEPRVIKIVPSLTTPVPEQVTFQFQFNEPVDPAPWQTGGDAAFHFYKLSAAGPGGAIVAEKAGHAFIDPTNLILYFGPNDPIETESFYRIVFSGIRDMQGNALAEQTFHFFSFDKTKPFVRLVSPVPDTFPLISGVEYVLGADLRNGTADGTPATDVATVDYMRVDGTAETFLTTITKAPFAYRFVAPEAPPAGITFTLRARATDGSANVSDPATISWTVKPNAPPQNVALTFTPASVYPANSVVSSVTFEDEGTFATVVVAVSATRLDGSAWASTQTKQITRATVADPWPPAQITFALPSDLNPTLNANFTATVTDVRGLSTPAAATLTLLADTGKPSILSVTPAAETTYHLNDKYTIVATVTDAETAVAEVDFVVDGHTYPVLASSPAVVAGPVPGSKLFPSPQITVPAKNIDTRISVVINARDYQGNTSSKAFELIYIGVNDPAIPKGSWLCPVDRSVIPAAQTTFVLPLRAKATDDIAVTSVKFRVPGIVDPIDGTRVGTTDEYTATATLATTPAAGSDFVLTAIISDADTTHTIEVPIAVDIVAIDQTIDATQAITVDNVAQFDSKSILVRGATGRLVTHVPVTLQNLIVLDGARVESLGTTTAIEYKVDVTVVDRLYVDCASSIDVTSKGYLGGWGTSPDGSGTRNDSAIGRTAGNTTTGGPANSGGSHGGLGSSGDGGVTNNAYDPIGDPAQLGTGGSGNGSVPGFCCVPGGSGGGAVSIRTSSATDAIGRVVIAGEIRADGGGGGGFFRGGSGGSIRINARQVIVSGSALVSTNGGDVPSDGTGNAGPSGAGGRVAVTASERLDIPDILTQFESRGGTTPSFSRYLGAGSGTIFVRRPGQNYGELYVATATAPRPVRATPLSGGLTFDRVHIGGYALGRFDESVTIGTHVDDRSAMTGEPTAIVLLASDHPALSATAAPASGSDLIRASNVVVTWTASSIAGLANATTLLSAAPPARVDLFPAYPPTLTAQTTTIAVPATAPLGPATLTLRVNDRADRFTDAPVVTYIVVDNQPPAISAFTLNPESVYPGHSVTATVNASDDLAVTKLTLTTQIGASAPIVDARTPNAKTTEQTFTIPIPITTPGLTPVSVEAAVEDNFPGRAALKQTRSVSVLKDTLPPQLTLTRPALDELFDEGTGKFVEYRAAASDAEVDVKSVTVTVGDAAPVPLTKDATGWTVTLPVPNVDGTDIVTVPFTMTASDYESNTKTLPSRIRVRPLIDPNAPAVTWTCGSSGAMYPVGFAAKLGLLAIGSSPTNGVQKVEFFVDGSTTPISATRIGTTNQWEASYTIPDRPDGTVITIRGVATSVGGNPADLASKITVIVPSLAPITADLTIDSANAAAYANKTVVVQSGTVTIATPLTLDRLALLGGKLTHRAGGTEKLAVTTTRDLFVSCDASIDVTGAGFAQNETYPGATRPGSGSAGSHIGVGAVANPPAASTFGSVYQPQEGGGGGEHPNIANGQPGGGVVRLIASTVTNEGVIRANGRDRTCCFDVRGGAGGSIWVTANGIGGRGAAEVIGGSTYNTPTGGGGAISIESVTTPVLWQMSARAGFTASGSVRFGGAGTIYVRDTASTFGSVTIDNGGRPSEAADLPSLGHGTAQSGTTGATLATDRAAIPVYFAGHWVEITSAAGTLKGTWRIASVSGTTATLEPNATETIALVPGDLWQGVYRFDTLFAPNGDAIRSVDPIRLGANGVLNLTGPTAAGKFLDLPSGVSADTVTVSGNVSLPSITAANVTLKTGAVLSPPKRNNDPQPLIIASTDTMTIETGAALDATGRGFGGSLTWPGATLPGLATAGSHIGIGGISILPAASTFGSVYRPMEAGGGGEQANPDAGQPGGGVIRLSAATITNNGAIRANGMDRTCCFGVRGGGGGSIWVSGTTAVRGNGTAEAVGSATYDGPTGGGGAISIESGSADPILWTMSARAGSPVGGSKIGGAGTIYVRRATSTYGEVTIDNGGRTGQLTDLPSLGSGIAQANTTGATLVTDRATIPAYFAGHWIEIASGGAPKGTWRIATIAGSTITLAPNASESIALAPGDLWQGVYRFDTMFSPNGDPLRSADPIRLGANGVIDISGPTAAGKFLDLPSGLAADQVTLRGNVSVPSIDAANVTVKSGATLAPTRDTSNPRPLIISATGMITVESGGAIDATGRGFGGSVTYPGATLPGSVSAGSHLGVGGVGNPPAASTFGSVYRPLEAGGGGEHPNPDAGQAGGGVIHLTAANIINDGAIRANGADRTCCFGVRGGAGGSIWIASPALGGTGVVEARGSDTYDGPTGGGGAVSIESAGTSVLPWPVNANPGSYAGGYGATGGPGTIYVKRAGATYGDVAISNPYAFADQLTDLPSLGAGIAQSGTAGATLLTGRSTDIPPYFAGHWVEIKTAAGALKGVWRIASIAGRNATLAPNGAETIALEAGDAWRGAYRLDSLRLRSAKLITADRLIVTAPLDLDPSSSILGNNDGAPVVNAAQISITASAVGAAVIGRAGAALDQDKPITVIVTNVASGATYGALVANDGSFSAAVSGNSGDHLTVKARDGNYFPLESAPIDIGTLTTGAPTATQFDRAAWTTDPAFSAQLLAMNGTTLVVSSANLNGASSDKLAVLDTTDPLHPALVRTIPTTINHIRDLEVAGGWAYIAGDRFATIDLRVNGATPNFASGENYGERQAIAVQGGYAFTADANYLDGRLNVYDVTDPAAPRLMGWFPTLNFCNCSFSDLIAYGNDYLIGITQGSYDRDVVVIDRRQMNDPHTVADLRIDGFTAWRGYVAGTRLYLVSRTDAEMVVVNLANLLAPAIAGRMPLSAPAGGIRVANSIAFIAATTAGVVATNADPASLGLLGAVPTGGSAADVTLNSAAAYVANELGLSVIPISMPPLIDTARITLSVSTGNVNVAGAAGSITGEGALTVEVKNSTSAATATATVVNGAFNAVLPASAGDVITIRAMDGTGRVAGPETIGAVPFGSATTTQPITIPGDDRFRARTVKVEGTLLAVGGYSTPNNESDKLVVYDIANPSAPVKREVIATGAGGILDFDLAGGRAYIVGDRFITVDLRTPGSAPVNGDPYGNRLSSIVVSGSYAFTGYPDSDGRLFVWDVTNPAQLTVVGNVTITPGETTTFTDLLTYGPDYLIGISDSTSGWDVVVIDRRNVDAPVRAGGLHIPQIAGFRGKIDGSMLYVAGGDGGVAMVDLSNPAAPHLVSVLNTPGLAFGIEAAGSTVIVADRAAGVSFLDSSTGTLRLTGAQAIPGDGWDVALGGGSLFIANDLGLATIENVLAPPRINASLISVGADGTTTGQPGAITGGAPLTVTVQNLATSATSSATANANGSFVVPITAAAGATITVKATDAQSRVAGPVVVGTVPYGVGTTVPITIPADPSFRARTLRLSGTLLAVAGYSNDYLLSQALVVYDVTNPAAPILRNTIFMQLGGIRDIELANGWAYVVGGGFTTVDLNSPDLTVHQPNFQLGQQQSIALAGGYAFVAPGYEAAGTVYVYDVTSPASPRFLTQFDTAPDESIVFNDLLMFGPDYLVGIGNGSTGPVVHVIDRRDVNNLHSIGKLSTGAIAGFRGKIVGSTLYVAGVAGGLAVVDLSIPSAPRLVSTTPTAGLAYGVDSSGTTILVADKSAGVSLFDTSTGSPHLLGTFSLANSNAWDVVLNGTTAYIANELSLGIIDNVAAAPQIEVSSIAVAASTSTTATVTGVSAIHGKPPVTVQVRNEKTGTTSGSTPASATGSFTAIVTARPGEPLSIIATDGASRSTTASIGAVPFFTVVANERGGAEFDYYGLARRIGSDGATVVVSGGTLGGQFYSSSTLAQLFRLTPPSLATVDSGANLVFDSKVSGGYAFFAGDRFSTLSLTDPSPVANVAPADQCGFEYSVALSSHYAFTGSNECSEPSVGTINVYDVAAPAAPAYVRSQSMSPASNVVYRDLVATGTNVIFAISPDEQSDVTPIDVTNPGSLAAQPPFDIPGFTAFRGVLDGSTLYLAGGDAGVAVVDVSSPGAPVLRSIVNTPGVAFSVAVSATNEIIVADGGSGLTVVDTTDKLNPVVVGTQQLDGSAVDVKVIGNQIYAATETRFYVLTRP